jgi:hypothetical protein
MLHDDADWRADSSLYKLLRAHAALDGAADLSTAIESAASTIAPETLDSARRQFAQSMWDRSVVEMGVAMTQNRSEGSGRTFQVLASGAFPLILEKLQLNVGANARVNSLPTGHTTDLSASAGFFTGSQHWRASATYTILRTSSGDYRSALRAGAALPIGDGFWVAPEVHAILGEPAVVVRIGILYGALGR